MDRYDSQIYRVDGKNCFLEILNSSFSMLLQKKKGEDKNTVRKVQINMIQYSEKTHEQTQKLEFFLTFADALVLCNEIISGRLDMKIAKAAKEGKFDGRAINDFTAYWNNLGGKAHPSEKDFKNFKWLSQGDALSRQLKIQKSTKYKYMIVGEYGKGRVGDTGLIIPEGNRQAYIQIPVSENDALGLALTLQMHISAFWNQYYNKFANDLFPNQTCNLFIPDAGNTAQEVPRYEEEYAGGASEEVVTEDQNNREVEDSIAEQNTENSGEKVVTLTTTTSLVELENKGNYYLRVQEEGKAKIIAFCEGEISRSSKWDAFLKALDKKIEENKAFSFSVKVVEKNTRYYFVDFAGA